MKIEKNDKIKMDKALAYFLGWRIDNSFPDKDKVWKRGNAIELDTTFKFSEDWNALMKVKLAIERLNEGYEVEIWDRYCIINSNGYFCLDKSADSTLEATYRCLSEFVLEYNVNKIVKAKKDESQ